VNYEVNGCHYNKGYYLEDGIYPTWPIFVKTISSPKLPKEAWFAKEQEAARMDAERAFGILQQRFAVVRFPTMTWSHDHMWEVINCCVIVHNIIIENESIHPVPEVELFTSRERLICGTPKCLFCGARVVCHRIMAIKIGFLWGTSPCTT
jgi:hypothetical protein